MLQKKAKRNAGFIHNVVIITISAFCLQHHLEDGTENWVHERKLHLMAKSWPLSERCLVTNTTLFCSSISFISVVSEISALVEEIETGKIKTWKCLLILLHEISLRLSTALACILGIWGKCCLSLTPLENGGTEQCSSLKLWTEVPASVTAPLPFFEHPHRASLKLLPASSMGKRLREAPWHFVLFL